MIKVIFYIWMYKSSTPKPTSVLCITWAVRQFPPPQFARGAGKGTKTPQQHPCSLHVEPLFSYSWRRFGLVWCYHHLVVRWTTTMKSKMRRDRSLQGSEGNLLLPILHPLLTRLTISPWPSSSQSCKILKKSFKHYFTLTKWVAINLLVGLNQTEWKGYFWRDFCCTPQPVQCPHTSLHIHSSYDGRCRPHHSFEFIARKLTIIWKLKLRRQLNEKNKRHTGGENTAWKENNKSFALGLP